MIAGPPHLVLLRRQSTINNRALSTKAVMNSEIAMFLNFLVWQLSMTVAMIVLAAILLAPLHRNTTGEATSFAAFTGTVTLIGTPASDAFPTSNRGGHADGQPISNFLEPDDLLYEIPKSYCSPFGSYPNPLRVTQEDRKEFAPVVKFPTRLDAETNEMVPNYRVLDHTQPWEDRPSQLVTPEQHQTAQTCVANNEPIPMDEVDEAHGSPLGQRGDFDWFGVGRYDENRVGMYESDLFAEDDSSNRRTVHIGIDLDGPVGTPVHAFAPGVVHSVGYNPALGDYGNVVVLHQTLPNRKGSVYALYGHLDEYVVQHFEAGQAVDKGQMIGKMGNYWENGGWIIPHVHFQLSLKAPPTHDMPGAVAPKDRATALWDYPDPRFVLGELY